ncbi:MAG: Jag N-terminal domain-containing protein [Deltaproteobacteria bacterium]|nr:Jag N-terminal domain-containing protein [Deltaproteobacteria bacterium]MBW2219922.1 Jag N-terminal domain-containing protein [Deltaproteobacteria bacterium]
MKTGMEFEGKNVENAVENACEKLNINKNELKYDVISNGSSGIFGLVRLKKAKIKVLTIDGFKNDQPVEDRKRTENDYEGRSEIVSLVDEAFNVNGSGNNKNEYAIEKSGEKSGENKKLSKEPADLGLDILKRIVNLITDDTDITVEQDNEKVAFQINGGNSSVLIGKKGQNLEAIQYIIDKVINRHSEKRVIVEVDVEDYFQKRKEKLVELAEKLAEKVKKTRKPSTLKQMNIQERRIIHLALKKDRSVRTQSIGDGYYRKLVIIPKKGNFRKSRPANNNRPKVNAEN